MAGGAIASATAGRAFAQDPIEALLQSPQRGQWSDQFDAGRGENRPGTSSLPILSSRTPELIEQAMNDYRRIVSTGGWPIVPANEKLELGVSSPSVPILRKRLIISGDLPPASGNSKTFDSWVDGAVRRFQLRHGLPPDGVIGIVSERDVVRALQKRGADLLRAPVSEIMTTFVATCTPTDSVDSLSMLMTTKRVRHIPVMENGRLTGIVSIGDVVKTRMEELEAQQEQLQAYITRG